MAQNITLLGASYSDVPAVELPKTGGGIALFADPSGVTAAAADVASGKYFLDSTGELVAGTASGGGGSSSWTKVAETSYQVSTTATTAATVATLATGHSELWTSEKFVYVRIRDTAGKRAGYFYGSDQFFMNVNPVNVSTATSVSAGVRFYFHYRTSGSFSFSATSGTTGFGVFADILYSDGRVRIRSRYSSNSSLTIDGTYKVEVYLLDPAGGVLPFA